VQRVLSVRVRKVRRVLGVLAVLGVFSTVSASTVSTIGTSTVSTLSTFGTDATHEHTAATLQPSSRIATTTDALVAAPVFFHGRQIAVRRDVEPFGALYRLSATARPIYVMWRDKPSLSAGMEIRGEFWDIGRLQKDDPRFSTADLQSIVNAAANGQWPAREQLFVILGATAVDSPLPPEPTIRALALAPEHYIGQGVTVTGRFRGANLYADLPQSVPTKGRWDFVLQSADAAIWVTGIRPKGRNFDLDINSRIDTGRWLQVAGTVRREGPLAWIDATTVALASAPQEPAAEVSVPVAPTPPEPPPTVIFSMPVANDTTVDRNLPIKIQFSRDMDPASFTGRVRASYVGPPPPGAPADPPPLTARYIEGSRGLEIKFSAPLDRFRTVKIDLLEGIASNRDKAPLAPWSMTFTTGG
jgi:hypothetical protein